MRIAGIVTNHRRRVRQRRDGRSGHAAVPRHAQWASASSRPKTYC